MYCSNSVVFGPGKSTRPRPHWEPAVLRADPNHPLPSDERGRPGAGANGDGVGVRHEPVQPGLWGPVVLCPPGLDQPTVRYLWRSLEGAVHIVSRSTLPCGFKKWILKEATPSETPGRRKYIRWGGFPVLAWKMKSYL